MIIFVDMDEVVADTYGAHITHYNDDYQENLRLQDCIGGEVWQSVPEQRQESVRNHAWKNGFFRTLDPIKDSQDVLKELSKKNEVYIASAAMQFPNSLREKSEWLDEYFPFIHWRNRILCGDKHILKGDVLIDDRAYNLKHFDGRAILFGSPHNINQNGFERAESWKELGDKLL